MIELTDIRKVFNAGKPNEFVAVDGISLVIEARKVTGLVGPSGSGKTTLAGLIGCMARPTSGRIRLLPTEGAAWSDMEFPGGEITSLPERFLTEIRQKAFGFIFQQFHLIKGMTVLENVMLPAYPLGEPQSILKRRAQRLLDLLDIGSKSSAQVEWLSGGEAQRVSFARALVNDPSVIIAEEPTAHLDTKMSLELLDILQGLKDQGKTVIVASHDPMVFESKVVDRIIRLRHGRIESIGGGDRP